MVRGGRLARNVVRFVSCKSRCSVQMLRRDVAGRSAGRLFGHVSLVGEILEHGSVRSADQMRQSCKTRGAVRRHAAHLCFGNKKIDFSPCNVFLLHAPTVASLYFQLTVYRVLECV